LSIGVAQLGDLDGAELTLVALRGGTDAVAAQAVRDWFDDELTRAPERSVVIVDLEGLDPIDPAFAAMLEAVQRDAKDRGIVLRWRRPSRRNPGRLSSVPPSSAVA
jgi:anti-anti-sigma regulatory factor